MTTQKCMSGRDTIIIHNTFAYLVDALYNQIGYVFQVSLNWITVSSPLIVVSSTGQRYGTVQVNGRQVTIGGATTTSY